MAQEDELRERLIKQPAYILLSRSQGENAFKGLLEHSFTMDWSDNRVLIFWTGKAYSILGEHNLDGSKEVEAQLKSYKLKHPNWDFWAGNARDQDCPVEIDWWGWTAARLRGDKFGSRNARFVMKNDFEPRAAIAQAQQIGG